MVNNGQNLVNVVKNDPLCASHFTSEQPEPVMSRLLKCWDSCQNKHGDPLAFLYLLLTTMPPQSYDLAATKEFLNSILFGHYFF